MREQKHNFFGEKLSGQYTDVETLLDKINRQIKSGAIQVSNDPHLSPMKCLNWGITYQIYDCLYEHGALTPAEIYSLTRYRDPNMIAHILEYMSLIGITKPINHENITYRDVLYGEASAHILYEQKKWELTESIRE